MAEADAIKKNDELREAISAKAKEVLSVRMPEKVLVMHKMWETIGEVDLATFHQELSDSIRSTANDCRVALTKRTLDAESASDAASVHVGKKRRMDEAGTSAAASANGEQEFAATLGSNHIPDVVVESNKVIVDVIRNLKKELLEEIELLNTVKIWIQLNVPRIEDGNNFGVGIQEEMINELARAENDAINVMDSMTKYYVSRAKVVSKLMKYPTLEDYRRSVLELDEKELVNLRMCVLDLRNTYAILYDLIHKNKDKIERPRTSHHQHLY
eukprot:TRINITY_DN18407_c0_g1_i1.p1 TRINITY_DN18407_c0_g1~~TRINITY_DN18407_c0_g1_i1.p1  ORF type:complete len:307 (+),score=108.42 TRINITY_DN18407_c0_g1_i1:110-922(+)